MARNSPIPDVEARFNEIVEQYGAFLRQVIVRHCPKDLGLQYSDIEQNARMRLWHALRSEREIANLASYLYRIAATATLDAIRQVKSKREEQLALAEEGGEDEGGIPLPPADPAPSPERLAARRQLVRKVQAALARLPENRRSAVGLYLEGLTSQEIADLLGWSEPKARNHVYRGLRELRGQLRAEGVDYEIE
jgi:RNA polymerase sigma-70 factor, ECF subfamily